MNLSSGMSADKSADASADVLGRISLNLIQLNLTLTKLDTSSASASF